MLARRTFLISTLALGVSACGFNLKGFYAVPEALKQVQIAEVSTQPTALGLALITQLQTNGVVITESAPYRLEIEAAKYNRRAITLSARADAKEYELSGQTKFALYQRDATAPLIERTVSALRTYSDDSNSIALETLESRYRSELNQSMAEQIIRQYLSYTPAQ